MGSTQSTKRRKGSYVFRNSPDYTLLHSPSRQPLVVNDSLNLCDSSEKYQVVLKDIHQKSAHNEYQVSELLRNIQYLEHLLRVKNTAMEESIKDNTYNVTKIIDLEKKIEHLNQLLQSKNAELERCENEKVANEKKVMRLEKKIKRLDHSLALKSSMEESFNGRRAITLEQKIKRLKNCLASMNTVMEETVTENSVSTKKAIEVKWKNELLELKGLKNSETEQGKDLISWSLDDMDEMEFDEDTKDPAYVERIMGVILVLIFVVSVSIGMHL